MEFFLFGLSLFLLGAAHGLEPGHGKLLVTGYLTGSQAKMQDALVLGLLVAIFHTLSVACISALIVFLAFTFFKDSFFSSLEVLSGVVILILGLILFQRRFLAKKSKVSGHCACPGHHHDESAVPAVSIREQSSLKEVILLSLASGINPCPVALAALVGAFAIGKVLPALGGLALFSLGIGSVLVILGLLLIRGADAIQDRWRHLRLAPVWIARFSTIMVLLVGCYLISKPFFFPEKVEAHPEERIDFLIQVAD